LTVKTVENIRFHYSVSKNIQYRMKLATEGFTGKLITHNFRKIVNLLSPYKRGEKVVDVGCGWGYLISFLPSYVDVYAFDLSKKMLEVSWVFRKTAERVIGDAQDMGLRDGSFDKLFCIGLAGHIPRLREALEEMYRILKRNGLGVINFTNKFGLTNIPVTFLRLKAGYYFKYNTLAPLDVSFTYMEAKRLLENVGFRILQSYGWGFSFPYSIGQRVPNVANWMTEHAIRIQDSLFIKQISNAHVFKIKKV
jgi:ubiquinone/menaquinone biosynthesis C-methylase UbiE